MAKSKRVRARFVEVTLRGIAKIDTAHRPPNTGTLLLGRRMWKCRSPCWSELRSQSRHQTNHCRVLSNVLGRYTKSRGQNRNRWGLLDMNAMLTLCIIYICMFIYFGNFLFCCAKQFLIMAEQQRRRRRISLFYVLLCTLFCDTA